jgi:hypothetical protein
MKDKKRSDKALSQEERKIMERLWRHPQILEQVQGILEIAENKEGPLKTADEVGELLVHTIGDAEVPVRNGHRSLKNRLECLDYARALKRGLPIGSGMIESGHRHVLHARLKKAGAAWLADSAD